MSRKPKDWAADQDYWGKLSEEDKKWLEQFNSEFYYANFTKEKKQLHPDWYKRDCSKRRYRMRNDAMRSAAFVEPDSLDLSSPSRTSVSSD